VTFAIASQETDDVRVSVCPSFMMGASSSGQFTATDMWNEIKKVQTFPSIHPSLNSELLSSESLTLHAPDMFAATAWLVRPRRRLQRVDGGVEARVLRRGGGGGVDGRAGGGDTGGVLLAGLGVPRCQVRRRDNVPQVRRAASC